MPDNASRDAGAALTCAVIVCTRARNRELARCLDSLQAVRYPGMRTVVVENGESTGAESIAQTFGTDYIFEPSPGLSRARNIGARAVGTDLVAFIDDDAVADLDWIAAAAPEFSDAAVGVVTGPIPDFNNGASSRDLGNRRFTVDRDTDQWFARANFGGVGHGGNMVFRRTVFDTWRGFDERLGRGAVLNGGEESFALFEVIDQGWRVVYSPAAKVYHAVEHGRALRNRAYESRVRAVAYFMFLYAEAPRYRHEVLRYVTEGLRGKPRAWRTAHAGSGLSRADRWQAALSGALMFLGTRRAQPQRAG